MRRLKLLLLTLLIAVSTVIPQSPALAGASCGGHDHYHDRDGVNNKVFHDARYRFRTGSKVYKRWDVWVKQGGRYVYAGRANAFCWNVDIT